MPMIQSLCFLISIIAGVLPTPIDGRLGPDVDVQRHGRSLAAAERANDVATSMAVDSAGNTYVVGYSKSKTTGYDYLIVKYDGEGVLSWATRLDAGADGDDRPIGVKVDEHQNVYVSGASQRSKFDTDYLTAKFDSRGKLLWKQRCEGEGGGFDVPTAMEIDGSGSVYVTGYSFGKDKTYDCLTVKYDSGGKLLWKKSYSGPGQEDDVAEAIGVDSAGNCTIAGYSKTHKNGAEYLTVQYGTDGTVRWLKNFSLGNTAIAKATGLVVGPDGSVCVTGFAQGSRPSLDYLTVRYDSNGKALWSQRLDGPGHGDDKPAVILQDKAGNYYLTGEGEGEGGALTGTDILTVKLSPDGRVLWQRQVDGSGLSDSATGMALDPVGGSVVTGISVGKEAGADFLTVKLGADGAVSWRQSFNGEANDLDRPVGVGIDSQGCVHVAGYSWGGKGSGFDFVAIKYLPNGTLAWVRRYDGGGVVQ